MARSGSHFRSASSASVAFFSPFTSLQVFFNTEMMKTMWAVTLSSQAHGRCQSQHFPLIRLWIIKCISRDENGHLAIYPRQITRENKSFFPQNEMHKNVSDSYIFQKTPIRNNTDVYHQQNIQKYTVYAYHENSTPLGKEELLTPIV